MTVMNPSQMQLQKSFVSAYIFQVLATVAMSEFIIVEEGFGFFGKGLLRNAASTLHSCSTASPCMRCINVGIVRANGTWCCCLCSCSCTIFALALVLMAFGMHECFD